MEFNQSSDFIIKDKPADAEMLEQYGATSIAYKMCINGKMYFIKRLRPELCRDSRYRDLFYKEYNTAKNISNPYIVKYLDIKEDTNGLHILMEYVNGYTLKEKLETEPEFFKHQENVKRVLQQLCEALKTLHKENIVHLDINPNNIIITQTSNNVKLIDFGFCLSDYNDQTGGSTAKFGAPEVAANEIKLIDARSDIYSIGRLLQYIEEKSGAKLPAYIRRIKTRCLLEQKTDRPQNCDEIIRKIDGSGRRDTIKIVTAVAVFTLLALSAHPAYNAVNDYIAWESGEIADKFKEGDIFYRITDHSTRTVAVTYKGSHHSEYMFEYKDGVIELPSTVTHRGRQFRVTSIDSNTFDNPETTGIILPEGIETIKDLAFVVCRLTGEVHIPKSIRHIGKWTFEGNTHIEGFVVDEANPVYDSRGGCNAIIETATNSLVAACANTVIPHSVTAIGENAFAQYQKTHITIPQSVTSIGNYAFGQSELREITLPANITELAEYAFENCTRLTKVVSYIPAEKLRPTGSGCFNGIDKDCILYVPRGARRAYEKTQGWNTFARIVEM